MIISAITAGLLLGLSQSPIAIAFPTDANGVVVTHVASDYFPNAKGDLTPFNVDARYVGYSTETQSWLTSIKLSSGKTDEEKAILIIEAAYAYAFNPLDPNMATDLAAILAAVAGSTTTPPSTVERRSLFQVSAAHAVKSASCAGVFSCLSGTTWRLAWILGRRRAATARIKEGQIAVLAGRRIIYV